jgi:PTS system mannose-specific IIB component
MPGLLKGKEQGIEGAGERRGKGSKELITLVRVDDRLLHGQVLHAWVPATGADTLLVVADEERRKVFEREMADLSGLSSCEIIVLDLAGAVRFLKESAAASAKVLVVLPGLRQALELFRAGITFSRLNIGNIHHAEFSERLSPSVVITEEEREALEALRSEGVELDMRALPRAGAA